MSLSDFSIRNSVFAWMLMASLILFGWIGFRGLGISQMPDADFPIVAIHIGYPGAAPEIMESDVIDVVEDEVMSVQGIRSVSSTALDELAMVIVEFDLDRDIDVAVQEIQAKLAQAQLRLPNDIEPPVVMKTNPEDQPLMWIAVYGDHTYRELMEFTRDHLKDRLQTVTGVGEIMLGGYLEPNLRIWIDPQKLARFELTAHDVVAALRDEHIEVPAGRLETDTTEIRLRSMGEALSVDQLEQMVINRRGGRSIFRPIHLRDVATVERGLEDARRISRTNEKPAVGLGIKKQRGTNAVEVVNAVKARLAELTTTLPSGYHVQINFDATRFIKDATNEMEFNLVLSVVLTAVVCLLFLASWGSTLNVVLAIPTSIVGTFLFIYFFGFTLNTFTLLALILAIGIVVDDAIIVLENIVRHQEGKAGKLAEGEANCAAVKCPTGISSGTLARRKSAVQAARDGAREITPAVIATTLSLIAIFVPVIFMKGVIGRFFFQFGVVLSVAVALSLLEAITITPMRCSRLLAHTESQGRLFRWADRFFSRLNTRYAGLLTQCLRHRGAVVGIATVVWVASLGLVPGLKKEFVPAQDQSMFLINAQTPIGSSLEFTDTKSKAAEAILTSDPAVTHYYCAVGGFEGGDVNTAMLFVSLKAPRQRPVDATLGRRPTQTDVMDRLRTQLAQVADYTITFLDLSLRGYTADRGFPVEFTIRGPEWDQLTELSTQMVERMKSSTHFTDVDTGYQHGQPEIRIVPNRASAAARGVSMVDIGETVGILMGGTRAGKFTEQGHRNDIRVRLQRTARERADDINALLVRNAEGELIPLRDVVTLHEHTTLKSITRRDRERAIGLSANIGATSSQERAIAEVTRLAGDLLPDGYRVVWSGSAEIMQESFQGLFFALILGIVVAYMVLGSQYNSFIHPLSVLMALPFSITGALLALKLFGQSLNIFSFIGIILLMGIVKKNSILLIDFTNQRRREGLSTHDALLTACPQRLRPILITSLAILAAAIPPSLAIGPGAETRIPMAITIIGGVIVSTFLTLFVVPCAYSLLARFERAR